MELVAEFGASQGILLGMSKQTAGTAFPFYKEGAVPAACLDSLSPARELIQCITQLAALWQHRRLILYRWSPPGDFLPASLLYLPVW